MNPKLLPAGVTEAMGLASPTSRIPARMALLRDLKERRRKLDLEAEREAKKEARQKAALRREILTVRQKLSREAGRKGCTVERRKEIAHELDLLRGIEFQECGRHPRKHPSYTRPSAKELRFDTDAPGVDEILKAAIIQQGLDSKKHELMIAKLAENDPEWDEAAKREAQYNPKIEQARKRLEYGDIKGFAESKWSNVDRVIAGHYFKSPILRKPLRELSADKASVELRKLEVGISPQAFERALRRLYLGWD
jgi:hypothetical protein